MKKLIERFICSSDVVSQVPEADAQEYDWDAAKLVSHRYRSFRDVFGVHVANGDNSVVMHGLLEQVLFSGWNIQIPLPFKKYDDEDLLEFYRTRNLESFEDTGFEWGIPGSYKVEDTVRMANAKVATAAGKNAMQLFKGAFLGTESEISRRFDRHTVHAIDSRRMQEAVIQDNQRMDDRREEDVGSFVTDLNADVSTMRVSPFSRKEFADFVRKHLLDGIE